MPCILFAVTISASAVRLVRAHLRVDRTMRSTFASHIADRSAAVSVLDHTLAAEPFSNTRPFAAARATRSSDAPEQAAGCTRVKTIN
jgi:hypothetical protein